MCGVDRACKTWFGLLTDSLLSNGPPSRAVEGYLDTMETVRQRTCQACRILAVSDAYARSEAAWREDWYVEASLSTWEAALGSPVCYGGQEWLHV